MINKKYNLLAMFLLAFALIMYINPQQVQATTPVKIIMNNKVLETDTPPMIVDSRVLVPFRVIFESLGANDVKWINSSREIKATLNGTLVELQIGNKTAYKDNKPVVLDTPAIIKNGRTLVPIRFLAELNGENEVSWDASKREVHIVSKKAQSPDTTKNNEIQNKSLNKGLNIGDNVNSVVEKFGQPDRKDTSELGFTWYVYNNDLSNYFQIGIQNDKVVSFGSNSTNWEYDGFKIGEKHSKLTSSELSLDKGKYTVNVLSDKHNNNIVSTILITNNNLTTKNYTEAVLQGLSLQLHDLINVYRVRNGVKPLEWNNRVAELAKYHSLDMATNNFFSHKSSNGDTFSKRADRILGTRFTIAENISAGHSNSIHSANGLYNSLGHREIMLEGKYLYSGTYVAYNANSRAAYYTHNFSGSKGK